MTTTNKVYSWHPLCGYSCDQILSWIDSKEAVVARSVSIPATPIAKLVAGSNLTGALTEVGEVYSWGIRHDHPIADEPAEFLDPESSSINVKKVYVADGALLTDVSMGKGHVVALTRDGRLFSAGNGDAGQLGIGPAITGGDEYESVQPGDEWIADWVPMTMDVLGRKEIDVVFCGGSTTFVNVKLEM